MAAPTKKAFVSRNWFRLLLLGTGLVLLVIAFMPMDDGWEAIQTRIAARQTEALSRKIPRAVLTGKPVPGNAWDDYNIAMKDALAWKTDPNGLLSAQFAEGKGTKEERQTVLKLIADHGALLDHVHRGALKEDGQYPFQWQRGPRMEMPSLLASRRLANFAAARAWALLDDGRPQDSVILLLDLAVLARDHAANGPLLMHLLAAAIYTQACDGLRNTIQSGKLSSAELKGLAEKLASIDRDMPDIGMTLANESLESGSIAVELANQRLPATEWTMMMASGGWRYGLSSRRMAIDLFNSAERFAERSRKLGEMNFKDAVKEADAIGAEKAASRNPVVRMMTPSYSRAVIAHREVIAKLRLLRAAAILKSTGKMPDLADPFGADLLMSESEGAVRIWSLGTDGVNQNGIGSWSTYPAGRGEDLVLELSR